MCASVSVGVCQGKKNKLLYTIVYNVAPNEGWGTLPCAGNSCTSKLDNAVKAPSQPAPVLLGHLQRVTGVIFILEMTIVRVR